MPILPSWGLYSVSELLHMEDKRCGRYMACVSPECMVKGMSPNAWKYTKGGMQCMQNVKWGTHGAGRCTDARVWQVELSHYRSPSKD